MTDKRPVYFIQHPGHLSLEAHLRLIEALGDPLKGTELEGAKFVVLEEGMTLRSHRLAATVDVKDMQQAVRLLRENGRRDAANTLAAVLEEMNPSEAKG